MFVLHLARPLLALTALIGAIALGLHVSPSSGAGPQPAQRAFLKLLPDSKVGKVEGTRAYIALSYDGKRLRAYVCDAKGKRHATISKWLKGRWDGRSPLNLVSGGVELRIEQVHADGRIGGQLTAFSGPHRFTVEPATGPAGLYDGIDRRHELRATWIVLADRSVRGAMIPTRPPRRVCRLITVVLADGTTQERVACYDV